MHICKSYEIKLISEKGKREKNKNKIRKRPGGAISAQSRNPA
jgi:hypothetical protein